MVCVLFSLKVALTTQSQPDMVSFGLDCVTTDGYFRPSGLIRAPLVSPRNSQPLSSGAQPPGKTLG